MKAKGRNREMANEESLDPAILIFAFWYPFSDGGQQALLLAWGFGRYAPEASVGMAEIRRNLWDFDIRGGRPCPPPPPRRNQCLMVPSGPSGHPVHGTYLQLRQASIRSAWPPVTEGLL